MAGREGKVMGERCDPGKSVNAAIGMTELSWITIDGTGLCLTGPETLNRVGTDSRLIGRLAPLHDRHAGNKKNGAAQQ